MKRRDPLVGGSVRHRLLLMAMIGMGALMLAPILWAIILSFKSNADMMLDPGSALRPPYTLQNYRDILMSSSVFRWLANSAIVSLGVTIGVLALSSLAGYGFARLEFPGRRILFWMFLIGLAIPEQSVIIARHQLFGTLDLHNTYLGLILPGLSAPFGVLLMTQYFKAIPKEVEQAALLDGATRLQLFRKIFLPMSIPAQVTLGIFTFLSTWNEYWWPLISGTNKSMFTLTVGIASMQMNFAESAGVGFLMAQAVLASIPIFLVYFFFQQYIISAVSAASSRP